MTAVAAEPYSPARKLLLGLEITSTFLRIRRVMRRRTIQETLALIRSPSTATGTLPLEEALHLGTAVRRTLALLPGDTRCLMQSLVLSSLLERRGAAATLVIGVRPGARFGAHAWVEHSGRALLPSYQQGFQRLLEL